MLALPAKRRRSHPWRSRAKRGCRGPEARRSRAARTAKARSPNVRGEVLARMKPRRVGAVWIGLPPLCCTRIGTHASLLFAEGSPSLWSPGWRAGLRPAHWARLKRGSFLLRRRSDASWTSWTHSLPIGKREWLQTFTRLRGAIRRSSPPRGTRPAPGPRRRPPHFSRSCGQPASGTSRTGVPARPRPAPG